MNLNITNGVLIQKKAEQEEKKEQRTDKQIGNKEQDSELNSKPMDNYVRYTWFKHAIQKALTLRLDKKQNLFIYYLHQTENTLSVHR